MILLDGVHTPCVLKRLFETVIIGRLCSVLLQGQIGNKLKFIIVDAGHNVEVMTLFHYEFTELYLEKHKTLHYS